MLLFMKKDEQILAGNSLIIIPELLHCAVSTSLAQVRLYQRLLYEYRACWLYPTRIGKFSLSQPVIQPESEILKIEIRNEPQMQENQSIFHYNYGSV